MRKLRPREAELLEQSHIAVEKLSRYRHPELSATRASWGIGLPCSSGELGFGLLGPENPENGPLPMYMELELGNGLAGRMEFCRASSSLEGGGS